MLSRTCSLREKLLVFIAAGAMAVAIAGPERAFAQENTNEIDAGTSASIGGEDSATDIFVSEQGDGQVSANRYIGQSVYNSALEIVGEINDLVLSKDGRIEAAVIGFGGFLGMGEKNVAVSFDAIEIIEDTESDAVELMVNLSAEELEAAPVYKTKAMKLAEMRAEEAERERTARDVIQPVEPPAAPTEPAE